MKTGNPIQEYVQKFAPKKYAKIENPETYFSSLMQELLTTEREIIDAISPKPWEQPQEEKQDPMLALGRGRARHAQASEMAWNQIVLERFPAEVDEAGEPLQD